MPPPARSPGASRPGGDRGQPRRRHCVSVTSNAGRTVRARSLNRDTASLAASEAGDEAASVAGRGSGSTGSVCSPRMYKDARLVASTCSAGQDSSRVATNSAVVASTCSQLSRMMRRCSGRRSATRVSVIERSGLGTTPSAVATVTATNSASATGASSTNTAPWAKCDATSPAIASASRVLPTPPGPVNVRRGTASSRSSDRAVARSDSRPMRRVRGMGRASSRSEETAAMVIAECAQQADFGQTYARSARQCL